jgi:hypothetical protein
MVPGIGCSQSFSDVNSTVPSSLVNSTVHRGTCHNSPPAVNPILTGSKSRGFCAEFAQTLNLAAEGSSAMHCSSTLNNPESLQFQMVQFKRAEHAGAIRFFSYTGTCPP